MKNIKKIVLMSFLLAVFFQKLNSLGFEQKNNFNIDNKVKIGILSLTGFVGLYKFNGKFNNNVNNAIKKTKKIVGSCNNKLSKFIKKNKLQIIVFSVFGIAALVYKFYGQVEDNPKIVVEAKEKENNIQDYNSGQESNLYPDFSGQIEDAQNSFSATPQEEELVVPVLKKYDDEPMYNLYSSYKSKEDE